MANPQRPRTAAPPQRPQRRRRLVIRRSGRRARRRQGYGQLRPSSDTIVRTAGKRPVRARVARTRRPAHAGRPGSHIPPQLYVAVAELLAWLYRLESREIPADATPPDLYLRNLHRVGRQRSGISAHPAGRHAFRAVRAHPPRQPHPGARRRRSRDRRAHPGGGQARVSSSGGRATTPARTSNSPTAWACSAAPPSTFTPRPMGRADPSGCSGRRDPFRRRSAAWCRPSRPPGADPAARCSAPR